MSENYEPCFYDVSDDWQERWSLIREFTKRWHGIQFRDRTELLPLVEKEEEKLGFKLPLSFQEYIIFSNDANSIVNNKIIKVIRDDYKVEYLEKLLAISLLRLSEGDAFWAVTKDNLEQTDPPVETYMLNDIGRNSYDDYALIGVIKEEGFQYASNYSSSITDFVLDMNFSFLNGRRGSYVRFRDVDLEFITEIENTFQRKSNWGEVTIYENLNILATLSPDRSNLTVRLWKKLLKEDVPSFLFEYKPSGGQHPVGDNIFNL